MGDRPVLNCKLDSDIFRSFYFLKEELVDFCRQEGLQTIGGKIELTDRIAQYLSTGEKIMGKSQKEVNQKNENRKNENQKKAYQKSVSKEKDSIIIGTITEDSIIEDNFVCSERHRAFLKSVIGDRFSFNVLFQKWLKANAGKTYKDAVRAYFQIVEDKKKSTTDIDRQFEYNTYIRDFFKDNEGKLLKDAILCWKYKKGLQGHNRYERQDLIALK